MKNRLDPLRPARRAIVIAAAACVLALPSRGRAVGGLEEDVRCLEPEALEISLHQPDLEVDDLRLGTPELAPPVPGTRPARLLGFGSALFGLEIGALALFPPTNGAGATEPSSANFRSAFNSRPTWLASDPWTTSYVAHPLMGSLLYTAARRSNYGPLGSFLFASAASAVWTYGVESWYGQPAVSDLVVMSAGGALLGEARWWARQRLLRDGRPGFWGQLGLLVADPIAEAQLLFQSVAGRKVARDVFGDELL